jgi:hypothetical protein
VSSLRDCVDKGSYTTCSFEQAELPAGLYVVASSLRVIISSFASCMGVNDEHVG